MTDPRNVQGSDADRAEGGLDVENALASFTPATDRRLGREARAAAAGTNQAQNQQNAGSDDHAGS